MTPEVCPNCDAEVTPGARACPECGADEQTGWSQSAYCDRLGISDPDEEFDHAEFVRQEFGAQQENTSGGKRTWIAIGILLLILLLYGLR